MQPVIEAWQKQYHFQLVVVSADQKEDLERFFSANNIPARVLQDLPGSAFQQYGVQVLPSDFLIDEEGMIKNSFIGWQGQNSLQQLENWLQGK